MWALATPPFPHCNTHHFIQVDVGPGIPLPTLQYSFYTCVDVGPGKMMVWALALQQSVRFGTIQQPITIHA